MSFKHIFLNVKGKYNWNFFLDNEVTIDVTVINLIWIIKNILFSKKDSAFIRHSTYWVFLLGNVN